MIIKLCSVLVALKPGGYRRHPTGKGTEDVVEGDNTSKGHSTQLLSQFFVSSSVFLLQKFLSALKLCQWWKSHYGGSKQPRRCS